MNKKMILATADWCSPCKVVKKEIEKNNYEVDIKDYVGHSQFFLDNNIKSVPQLFVYEDEKLISTIMGIDNIIQTLKESKK